MKPILILVSVVTLLSACTGAGPASSPIAPSPSTPSAPAGPQPTSTLSGVISEVTPSGRVPVEGVLLEEVSCGPVQQTTTDLNGFYRLSGWSTSQTCFLWLSKKGYQADEQAVTISVDTRLDLDLVRQ